jgi:hypothetical protein
MAETSRHSQIFDRAWMVGRACVFVACHQLDVFGVGVDFSCVPADQVVMFDLRCGPWVLRIGANR